MKIYTKKGDEGKTSLIDGSRVWKNELRVEAYGTVDELNSHLGMAVSFMDELHRPLKDECLKIQSDLFSMGSALASPVATGDEDMSTRVEDLERLIDQATSQLPALRSFILPGGSQVAASLHVCRTVARRAERLLVTLRLKNFVHPSHLQYLNRLSDLFFVWARLANQLEGVEDILWSSRR